MKAVFRPHLRLIVKQAPTAALRAQRSKDNLPAFQNCYRPRERDCQGMSVNDCNMKLTDRPRSYVVDLVMTSLQHYELILTS